MDSEEIRHVLYLLGAEGIGSVKAARLIHAAGSVQEVFNLSPKAIASLERFGQSEYEALQKARQDPEIESEMRFIEQNGIRAVAIWEDAYPPLLRNCPDAPLMFFAKGNFDFNTDRPHIAIVGTREITPYGKIATERLIADLKEYNPVIVSGLAYGVDACAHFAALKTGLDTVAVLGNGLAEVYPPLNAGLARQILEGGGAVISEYRHLTEPKRENFPQRNRIVAGMCAATIVIEGKIKGGALITANLAHGYDRDVFALPGRINDVYSLGCNRLIAQNKAVMIESTQTIIDEMGLAKAKKGEKKQDGKTSGDAKPTANQMEIFPELSDQEKRIFEKINQSGKIQVDELCSQLGVPTYRIMPELLNMELKGIIRALPGKYYAPGH